MLGVSLMNGNMILASEVESLYGAVLLGHTFM